MEQARRVWSLSYVARRWWHMIWVGLLFGVLLKLALVWVGTSENESAVGYYHVWAHDRELPESNEVMRETLAYLASDEAMLQLKEKMREKGHHEWMPIWWLKRRFVNIPEYSGDKIASLEFQCKHPSYPWAADAVGIMEDLAEEDAAGRFFVAMNKGRSEADMVFWGQGEVLTTACGFGHIASPSTVTPTWFDKLKEWWASLPKWQKNTGLYGCYGLVTGALMMYVLELLFPRKTAA